ncbi:molybdate ABC transporter substrate-binding protein [Eggerthella sinensis]|jgi:molybdate transport system substrate-binding protein|uniref:Molybdate ABC transporter substrate-binding protein n=1 Tax=Eggerthella sinensis TaxID=242230 RepID=A0A3N0IUL3_9ACTN|nr:molybdate ABC transporter substrate-binding protein [Eggerthella sinensis]RDB69927.1 molybdate ABC transporter substrate-binding protein [Eggerthella sinensis]RNM40668.1 molybdate ABC transporter substrate-binding protein [Eggerthella sinensis]
MKKHIRIVLAAACAFAMVGAFALFGCSAPAEQKADEPQQQAEPQAETEKHEAVELQLFAANSLSKAMDAVQQLYTQDHDWVTFKDTQYLSSGELNEQLAGGAYADVLISASKGKMDDAVEKGYVDEATRFDMFKNDLVMVAGEDSELAATYGADQNFTLDDIATGDYTVAVGDASVPAGNYANQALSTIGCFTDADGKTGKDSAGTDGSYDGTPLEGKINLQSSVGNVCKQAQSGAVDVAFVYSSDVYRFGGVKVIGVVPADTHKNIIYPAAICKDSTQAEAATEFIEWATTDAEAKKLWQEWGFELVS